MIPALTVTKFAQRQRLLNLLDKKQEKVKEDIKERLIAGEGISLDGPYTLDISQVGGKDFSWEVAYRVLKIQYLREYHQYSEKEAIAIAELEMKQLKDNAPDKESVTVQGKSYVGGIKLKPVVNAKYNRVNARKEAAA